MGDKFVFHGPTTFINKPHDVVLSNSQNADGMPPKASGEHTQQNCDPSPFHYFSSEMIDVLYRTAISVGLAEERAALLGGIGYSFVAQLPTDSTPAAQILTDLRALNSVKTLVDGTVPLKLWIANALALSASRCESAVFQGALNVLTLGSE